MSEALNKALLLLGKLADSERDMSITELSRAMGVPKATAYRLAATLEERGFLRKDPETTRYSLGLALWELGRRAVDRLDLRPMVRPWLHKLAEVTQETALFAIHDGNAIVYLDRVESEEPIQINPRSLGLAPFYASAAGKLFLAHSPEPLLERLVSDGLASFTPHTITSVAKLRQQLSKVLSAGCATSIREWRVEMSSLAVPVMNAAEELVGALVISGLAQRFEGAALAQRIATAIEIGRMASRDLGFRNRHAAVTGS